MKGKGKGEKGKGDKKCKGKGKGKANAKTTKHFPGYCLVCEAWGHAMKDCWRNESAKSGKDTASLETPIAPAANTTTEPSITGMLTQSHAGAVPADLAQWLYSVTKRQPSREEFLIDSGAATSVCQQSLADSLGGKPRGPGVELRSATGHQFTTPGNTTMCLRTRDGVNVAGDFQIAPKSTGLQGSVISVGQVCDRGNNITFSSTGGRILNEFTGNRIEFERAGGVYRLRADTNMKSDIVGVKVLMRIEQDTAGAAETQPVRPGNEPVLPSEAEVERHQLTHLPF